MPGQMPGLSPDPQARQRQLEALQRGRQTQAQGLLEGLGFTVKPGQPAPAPKPQPGHAARASKPQPGHQPGPVHTYPDPEPEPAKPKPQEPHATPKPAKRARARQPKPAPEPKLRPKPAPVRRGILGRLAEGFSTDPLG